MSEIKAPARNPSELSLAALQKGAELHGAAIKFAKNMTAEKAADILTKHLEADYGADNLVACATCGYGSTESDATCPFCGMAFTSDPPADIETILTPAVVPANEPPPVEVEPAKRGRGRPKGSGKKAPPSPKKGTGKRGRPPAVAKKKTSTAKPPAEEIVVTNEMIERSGSLVDLIKQQYVNITEHSYEIGLELRELHDNPGLIKARGHKSFNAFIEKEFTEFASRRTAYNFIALTTFDKPTALKLGTGKAAFIAALPPKKQKVAVETVETEGTSLENLKKKFNDGSKSSGVGRKGPVFEDKITMVGRVQEGPQHVDFSQDDEGLFIRYEIVTGFDLTLKPIFDEDEELIAMSIEVTKVTDAPAPAAPVEE